MQTAAEMKVGLPVSDLSGAGGSSSSSSSSSAAGPMKTILRTQGTLLDLQGMQLGVTDTAERAPVKAQEYLDALLNSTTEEEKLKKLRDIKKSTTITKRSRVDPKSRKPCKPRSKFFNAQTHQFESEEIESSDEEGNPGYDHLAKRSRRVNKEERDKYAAMRAGGNTVGNGTVASASPISAGPMYSPDGAVDEGGMVSKNFYYGSTESTVYIFCSVCIVSFSIQRT